MTRKRIFYLLMLSGIFASNPGTAQIKAARIEGRIIDEKGSILNGATIALLLAKDSSVISQVIGTVKGFTLSGIRPGKYVLMVSFSGYRTDTFQIQITGTQQVFKTGDIILEHDATFLKEVVVKSTPPAVKMSADTISYRAESFKTRVNSTVQDLLKKLPGVSIDGDGNISFQGKPIEKIYIDGKDYYLNDPKLITQNLTADMIERVEVYNVESEKSRLTGEKDVQRSKAVNLKLKKGVNLNFTGKGFGGYGTRNGYLAGMTGSSFVKNRAITGFIKSNNINDIADESPNPLVTYGRSSNHKAALNYSDRWGKAIKANLDYHMIGREGKDQRSTSNRQSLLADSSLLENHRNEMENKSYGHFLKGTWEISLDSFNKINIGSSITPTRISNFSKDTFFSTIVRPKGNDYPASTGNTTNQFSAVQLNSSNSIFYNRLSEKRGISVYMGHEKRQSDQQGALRSTLQTYGENGASNAEAQTNQQYTLAEGREEYSVKVACNESLKPWGSFTAGYQYNFRTDQSNRRSLNYDSVTRQYDIIDSLTSSEFKSGFRKHGANLSYQVSHNEFNYKADIFVESVMLQNTDEIKDIRLKRDFLNILPSASLAYFQFGSAVTRQFMAEYSSRSQQPMAYQLQPVTDNRNPSQLLTGNPDLKQMVSHNLVLNYVSISKRMQDLQVTLTGVIEKHTIVTSTEIISGGIQKTTYVNRDGKYAFGMNVNYKIPVGAAKKNNVYFMVESQFDHSPTVINGKDNVLRGLSLSPKTGCQFIVAEKLEVNMESNLMYTISRYTTGTDLNSSGLIQNYKLSFNYDLPFRLLLKSDGGLQLIGAQAGLAASRIFVWNASLLKNIFKNGHGEIKLSAYDILNSNKGFSQRITSGYIQQSTSNTLGTMVMLSAIYHLRSVPGKQSD